MKTEIKTTHTPTPWLVKDLNPNYGGCVLMRDTGHGLSRIDDGSGNFTVGNAAHIVKCVNLHEELLESLRECVQLMGETEHYQKDKDFKLAVDSAYDAIAKAEEK